jgi:murein DD-endopeptidase MepM/ murein hydrolase activator NlpD
LAATEALAASSDHALSSTGPGLTCATIAAGKLERMASKRAFESRISCRSLANGAHCCKASSRRKAFGVTGGGRDVGFGFTRGSVAMQIMITHGSLARTRVLRFNRWQIGGALLGLVLTLMLLSGTIYNLIFLKAAREGWPVVSQLVRLVTRDEFAQRDRFMRENLDAMAQRVGEVQAKMIKLDAISERVSGAVGMKPEDTKPAVKTDARAGQGGPFVPFVAGTGVSLDRLQSAVDALDVEIDQRADVFTLLESRLLESRLQALMVPNSRPVDGPVGSGFGFRSDPFTGRAALHTGLDFPSEVGTPVHAAAGGVVLASEFHPEYGNIVELDHGNGLVTRYAHNSRVLVKAGDLVKRGQVISEVGTSGRSTGPHLHFEVLVDGVPQDPAKFLAGGNATAVATAKSGRGR